MPGSKVRATDRSHLGAEAAAFCREPRGLGPAGPSLGPLQGKRNSCACGELGSGRVLPPQGLCSGRLFVECGCVHLRRSPGGSEPAWRQNASATQGEARPPQTPKQPSGRTLLSLLFVAGLPAPAAVGCPPYTEASPAGSLELLGSQGPVSEGQGWLRVRSGLWARSALTRRGLPPALL